MEKVLKRSILFIFLCLGLIGCSSGGEKAQSNEQVNETEKEEAPLDAALIAEGEKIVKSSCIGCHGVDLKGDMGPPINNLHYLNEEQIIEVLIKGRGSMPPASARGKEEEVAAYLLSLTK